MTLLAMLKKGRLRQSATATVATVATVSPFIASSVAKVATVAVAKAEKVAANDPAPTTTVQADLPMPGTKGLPTNPVDGAEATVRPPGLSAKLLAASLALDAQIHAAGQFDSSDENSDRWCWPHSTAMTGSEIDLFTARLARFTTKGVIHGDAELLADKLVTRDRGGDDRALCLECTHLAGYGRSSWRCINWQRAGIARQARDAQLPADLVFQLQRCNGFAQAAERTPT